MDVGVIALVGALVAPLITYIVAARKMSGRIQTTEASDLWAESASIRSWSKERIAELNSEVARLESRIDELEGERSQWLDEKAALLARLNDCELTIERHHREQVASMDKRAAAQDKRDVDRDALDAERDTRDVTRDQRDVARDQRDVARDQLDAARGDVDSTP